jgi:hypothetical protein
MIVVRKILIAGVAGAVAFFTAPALSPQGGAATTAQARPADAEDTGAKQMRMQANPPGSRFPYSYRY